MAKLLKALLEKNGSCINKHNFSETPFMMYATEPIKIARLYS